MLKSDFHLHTREDPCDRVRYTAKEVITHYARLGFNVMAITNHDSICYSKDLTEHAKKQGILLIKGIEARIEGKDVIILNPTQDLPHIKPRSSMTNYHAGKNLTSFDILDKQRDEGAFTIAAHPYFFIPSAMGGRVLKKNIKRFDAIEYSHFYSWFINRNKPACKVAKQYNKPVVATSDAHSYYQMNTNFTMIDAEKNQDAVFEAIRKHKFEIKSRPLSFIEFSTIFKWAVKGMIRNTTRVHPQHL